MRPSVNHCFLGCDAIRVKLMGAKNRAAVAKGQTLGHVLL